MKKLYRSESNKKVAGIMGGLGEYMDVDPVMLRLLWVFIAKRVSEMKSMAFHFRASAGNKGFNTARLAAHCASRASADNTSELREEPLSWSQQGCSPAWWRIFWDS